MSYAVYAMFICSINKNTLIFVVADTYKINKDVFVSI